MYKKRILILLILVFVVTVFSSCDGDIFTKGKLATPIDDSRLNGTFTYSYYWIDAQGIEEEYQYIRYAFNGTNKVDFYTKFYAYSKILGWTFSGDYVGDYYAFDYEFEVSGGKYRYRLWDNQFSSWYGWETYTFSPDGKTLTLYNVMNIQGLNYVLKKL